MNFYKSIVLFLIYLTCTYQWDVKILQNSNRQIQSLSVNIGECQQQKSKIINKFQHTTICTNSKNQSDILYQKGYKPLDGQYQICYRHFQSGLQQGKMLKEKSFKMISISLKEKDLFIDDILQGQFMVEFCGKQQLLSFFQISKPATTLQKLEQKLGNQNSFQSKPNEQSYGKGFHQKLNFTITPPLGIDLNSQQCSITIQDVLPQTTYIDVDQLKSYTQVSNNQVINIEKPQYKSKQYMYSFKFGFGQLKQIGPNTYNYLQPIHFRYARPSGSQNAEINIHCSQNMWIQCKNQKYLMKQDRDIYRGVAKIPVGDSSRTSTVTMFTFISQLMCALLLLKNLRK